MKVAKKYINLNRRKLLKNDLDKFNVLETFTWQQIDTRWRLVQKRVVFTNIDIYVVIVKQEF